MPMKQTTPSRGLPAPGRAGSCRRRRTPPSATTAARDADAPGERRRRYGSGFVGFGTGALVGGVFMASRWGRARPVWCRGSAVAVVAARPRGPRLLSSASASAGGARVVMHFDQRVAGADLVADPGRRRTAPTDGSIDILDAVAAGAEQHRRPAEPLGVDVRHDTRTGPPARTSGAGRPAGGAGRRRPARRRPAVARSRGTSPARGPRPARRAPSPPPRRASPPRPPSRTMRAARIDRQRLEVGRPLAA